MSSPKTELPQGTLDMLILKVVAVGPLHGYAIAQRIREISREALRPQQGTLYPALHRLENRGLLAANWKRTATGRHAKCYRITARGRASLADDRANWRRLSDAIGLILRTPEGLNA